MTDLSSLAVGDIIELRERYLGDEEEHVVRSLAYIGRINSKGIFLTTSLIDDEMQEKVPIYRLLEKRDLSDPSKSIRVLS